MYRAVLKTDNSRAEAHYKLGMSYLLENERRDAAQALQKAIHHGYDRPDVYEKLGYIYKELGRNQEAVDSFKKFLKQSNPSSLATETRREILNQIEALGG
jgi:Tfp pilus assembly protein PilF